MIEFSEVHGDRERERQIEETTERILLISRLRGALRECLCLMEEKGQVSVNGAGNYYCTASGIEIISARDVNRNTTTQPKPL